MRKLLTMLMALTLALCVSAGAMAAGVTLKTFTPFADMDAAAQAYMDLITAWEQETGNMVEDYSGLPDEIWMEQMRRMALDGEADLIVIPAGSGLTYEHVVTAQELADAAPDLGVRQFASMAEADGSVLLAPMRLSWEGLYVNTDVLERFGLTVPATYDELITVCAVLAQNGVTPISNALCEWAEITLDCAALAGAPQDQYGMQASLSGAQDVLMTLTRVGAFGTDAWNVSDMDAEARFLCGEAAMRFDADWLVSLVPAGRRDQVTVIAMPAKDGQARTAIAGTPAFGLAITRACWEDDARCEAALSLAAKLLGEDAAMALGVCAEGELGRSAAKMTLAAQDCAGLLYDRMEPEAYDGWAQGVIAALMAL